MRNQHEILESVGWIMVGGFNEFDIDGPPLASGRGLCEIDRV